MLPKTCVTFPLLICPADLAVTSAPPPQVPASQGCVAEENLSQHRPAVRQGWGDQQARQSWGDQQARQGSGDQQARQGWETNRHVKSGKLNKLFIFPALT